MTAYVPGREKNTRNSTALDAKIWAMVFVCCVTKLINIQIIETKDSSGICDGITRLSCEVGTPATMLIDQESSLMKVLKEAVMTYTTYIVVITMITLTKSLVPVMTFPQSSPAVRC